MWERLHLTTRRDAMSDIRYAMHAKDDAVQAVYDRLSRYAL